MLCTAGFDGFFKELNPAWERVLGFSLEELRAQRYIERVHPDDRVTTLAEAEKLAQNGTQGRGARRRPALRRARMLVRRCWSVDQLAFHLRMTRISRS